MKNKTSTFIIVGGLTIGLTFLTSFIMATPDHINDFLAGLSLAFMFAALVFYRKEKQSGEVSS